MRLLLRTTAIGYCLGLGSVWAQSIALLTEESPPHNMHIAGQPAGIGVEKVQAMFKAAQLAYTLDFYPWKRAYTMAQKMPQACLFSTTRTPERESQFQWIGPIAHTEWVIYAHSSRAKPLKNLESIRPALIGGYNGDAVSDHLIKHQFRVHLVNEEVHNAQKLLNNRIDYWATGKFTAQALIHQNRWHSDITPVLFFKKTDLYLACNLAMPPDTIHKINAGLDAIKKNKLFQKIDTKYEKWPAK